MPVILDADIIKNSSAEVQRIIKDLPAEYRIITQEELLARKKATSETDYSNFLLELSQNTAGLILQIEKELALKERSDTCKT